MKKYKSIKIEPDLMKRLKRFVEGQPNKEEAAEKLGLSRFTLHHITMRGTCNSDTLEKIQNTLK